MLYLLDSEDFTSIRYSKFLSLVCSMLLCTRKGIFNVERWQEALHTKGLRISVMTMERMEYNFSKTLRRDECTMHFNSQEKQNCGLFHHLGSIIPQDRG